MSAMQRRQAVAKPIDVKPDYYRMNAKICSLVERYPCMYDRSDPTYLKKDVVDRAWIEIAHEMNDSIPSCKERWRNIRTSFARSINVRKVAASINRTKPYYLHAELQFLARHITPGVPVRYVRRTIAAAAAAASTSSNATANNCHDDESSGDNLLVQGKQPAAPPHHRDNVERLTNNSDDYNEDDDADDDDDDVEIDGVDNTQRSGDNYDDSESSQAQPQAMGQHVSQPPALEPSPNAPRIATRFTLPPPPPTMQSAAKRQRLSDASMERDHYDFAADGQPEQRPDLYGYARQPAEPVDFDMLFLRSVLPDMRHMNFQQKLLFKRRIFEVIAEVFEADTTRRAAATCVGHTATSQLGAGDLTMLRNLNCLLSHVGVAKSTASSAQCTATRTCSPEAPQPHTHPTMATSTAPATSTPTTPGLRCCRRNVANVVANPPASGNAKPTAPAMTVLKQEIED